MFFLFFNFLQTCYLPTLFSSIHPHLMVVIIFFFYNHYIGERGAKVRYSRKRKRILYVYIPTMVGFTIRKSTTNEIFFSTSKIIRKKTFRLDCFRYGDLWSVNKNCGSWVGRRLQKRKIFSFRNPPSRTALLRVGQWRANLFSGGRFCIETFV